MKILVATKRVPDTDQKIVASASGDSVVVDHIPFVINPFDMVAVEEALRIGEKSKEHVEVVAVGIGESGYEQQLRTALAVGAGRAIHVAYEGTLDPWSTAQILRAVVDREAPQLVIMGRQAADDDASQTGQFLAGLLDWPQATFVSRVELVDGIAAVERETMRGTETIQVPLPAVITVELRLNEPRYATMAGILKSRKAPLDVITPAELGVMVNLRAEVLQYRTADGRARGERLNSIDELIERLTRPGAVLNGRV